MVAYNDTDTYTAAELDQFRDNWEDLIVEYRVWAEDAELFVLREIVNPSNSEYLLQARIPESLSYACFVEKEFTVTTNEYHWTSTITHAMQYVESKIDWCDNQEDYDKLLSDVLDTYPTLKNGASALTITEEWLLLDRLFLLEYAV